MITLPDTPCDEARTWLAQYSDPNEALIACDRIDWLDWLARRVAPIVGLVVGPCSRYFDRQGHARRLRMTSPYRALPVVRAPTRSVCAWCKHSREPYPHGALVCDARERIELDPVVGWRVVDRGRDCYVVRHVTLSDEECPDFEPTVMTRVLRAVGARR